MVPLFLGHMCQYKGRAPGRALMEEDDYDLQDIVVRLKGIDVSELVKNHVDCTEGKIGRCNNEHSSLK